MAEVEISVGGRSYTVACADGEEPYLAAAASALDREARNVLSRGGRLSESRVLLLAGLLLADRLAELEDRLAKAEAAPPLRGEPQVVEKIVTEIVEAVPSELAERLTQLAARSEEIAEAASHALADAEADNADPTTGEQPGG